MHVRSEQELQNFGRMVTVSFLLAVCLMLGLAMFIPDASSGRADEFGERVGSSTLTLDDPVLGG